MRGEGSGKKEVPVLQTVPLNSASPPPKKKIWLFALGVHLHALAMPMQRQQVANMALNIVCVLCSFCTVQYSDVLLVEKTKILLAGLKSQCKTIGKNYGHAQCRRNTSYSKVHLRGKEFPSEQYYCGLKDILSYHLLLSVAQCSWRACNVTLFLASANRIYLLWSTQRKHLRYPQAIRIIYVEICCTCAQTFSLWCPMLVRQTLWFSSY